MDKLDKRKERFFKYLVKYYDGEAEEDVKCPDCNDDCKYIVRHKCDCFGWFDKTYKDKYDRV